MPFNSYLTQDQTHRITDFFASKPDVNYDDDTRTTLLASLPNSYRGRMPNKETNAAQLAADLDKLNMTEGLADRTVPLRVWLINAIRHFSDLTGTSVFSEALEIVEKKIAERRDEQPDAPQVAQTDAHQGADEAIELLEKVWALIRKDDVAWRAVSVYGETINAALHDIDVITDFKSLHEGLHNLKMGWPQEFESVVAGLPDDPDAHTKAENLARFIGTAVSDFDKTLRHGNIDPERLVRSEKDRDGITIKRYWYKELADHCATLESAVSALKDDEVVNDQEKVAAKKATILTVYNMVDNDVGSTLSALNTQLKESVEKMRLGDLINALRKVCQELLRLDQKRTAEKVSSYQAGIDELSALDTHLSDLKDQHNQWQKVDDQLPMLDNIIVLGTKSDEKGKALGQVYDLLKLMIEPVYSIETAEWARNLRFRMFKMKAALDAKDVAAAGQWFQGYREAAKDRFYKLDGEMMKQCEELSKVGEKLRKIDNELENM
ncbi:MAG: hypothetical protein H7Z38_08430 [Rubrivivax sp.]|nr:hypothetical protein [Pyrinomonadaceae bacterium]